MTKYTYLLLLLLACRMQAQVPAFPGAEGGGKYTTGGRGGKILTVTSLQDDGSPGTLRWALRQKGPRIILFAVAGWIDLTEELPVNNGDVTIAGQSAPGGGVGLRNYELKVKADNVIIRYIRCRLGDLSGSDDDAMGGSRCTNLIIDHCSMSWSVDECASFYDNTRFTLQWCIISESLRNSGHRKGEHGYGGIWGGSNASFHHNLFAHHSSRTPRLCGSRYSGKPEMEQVDIRNNVFYNWGPVNGGYAGEGGSYNFVNNYYKPGPSTVARKNLVNRIFQPNFDDGSLKNQRGVWGRFYVSGNRFDGSSPYLPVALLLLVEAVNRDNWQGIHPKDTSEFWQGWQTIRSGEPFAVAQPEKTDSPEEAYRAVLRHAGASRVRDAVDLRIVQEVRQGGFTYKGSNGSDNGLIDNQEDVGGWPELKSGRLPADRDRDGMPDRWEKKHRLDPDKDDSALYTVDKKYTNIEMYLNSLVENNKL